MQPLRVQPPGSPGKKPIDSFPCIALDQWSQRATISACSRGIVRAVEVPLPPHRVDRLDRMHRHAPPLAVGDHVIDRLGKLPLDLAAVQRLGREQRGHEPELEDVVAERRDHVDEPFPVGPAPAIVRAVEEHVRIERVLQVLGEVDVADPHGEPRPLDHAAQFGPHRLPSARSDRRISISP